VHLASRFAPPPESRWQWIAAVLPLGACVRILVLPEANSPRTPAHYAFSALALFAAAAVIRGRLFRASTVVAPTELGRP
jgi:hypothetical protein